MTQAPSLLRRAAVASVCIGGALAILQHNGLLAHADRAAFLRLLAPLGPWAPEVFGGLVVLWVLVSLPIGVIYLAGGAALGLWQGILLNALGSAVGAAVAFVVGRYVARDLIAARLTGRAADLDRRLGSPVPLAIIRVTAIIPFGLVSYAAGLSAMPFRRFMAVTVLGMWPPLVFCTYLGVALADFNLLAGLMLLVALSSVVAIGYRWKGAALLGGDGG